MKILKLKTEGYRSLKNIEWKPGNLNILIGPNGSGKSNLLRVLQLISLSSKGRLGGHIQKSGGIVPLLWDGTADNIKFDVETSPAENPTSHEDESLNYEMSVSRVGEGATYQINYELLANYRRVKTGEFNKPFKFMERDARRVAVFDKNANRLAAPEESVPEEESLLSLTSPFTENTDIRIFHTYLKGWNIYHDLHINSDAPIRQPTITRHEKKS